MTPRRHPYTSIGIQRLRCSRVGCRNKAETQWQACSDGNVYRPLCPECDVRLNELAMEFLRPPGWRTNLRSYTKKMLG